MEAKIPSEKSDHEGNDDKGKGLFDVRPAGEEGVGNGEEEITLEKQEPDISCCETGLEKRGKPDEKSHTGDEGGDADEETLNGIELLGLDGTKDNVGRFFIRFVFKIFREDFNLAGTSACQSGDEEVGNFMNECAGKKNDAPNDYGGVLITTKMMDEAG